MASDTPKITEQPAAPKPKPSKVKALTPKRELFCIEYLKDFNATQAAIRAGYSPASARMEGPRLMQNDEIKARVSALIKDLLASSKEELQAKILRQYESVGFSSVVDLLTDDLTLDPEKIKANGGLVKEFEVMREKVNGQTVIKVKLHDKLVALGQLARYAQLIEDKPIKLDVPITIITRNEDAAC